MVKNLTFFCKHPNITYIAELKANTYELFTNYILTNDVINVKPLFKFTLLLKYISQNFHKVFYGK